jgi:hypothetical protein
MAAKPDPLGLPDGFKAYSPTPFLGMDTEGSPVAIKDQEFVWRENFVRLGDGNLRTVWDVGTPIYTAPGGKTIVWYGFYSLNITYYCAIFLSDGSAVQIDTTSLAQTTIGTSGFYSATTKYLPYIRQWGDQYIAICNRNTVNDYWIWDGSILYGAGTVAPNGVTLTSGGFNYSSTPTYVVFGGSGSGIVLDITEQAGSIVAANIVNPGSGYEVGDAPLVAFSGGGSDQSPVLIANLNAGGVGGVNITAPGSGYTSASVSFSGGGGTGAAGTVLLSTGVVSVPVTAGGTSYTYAAVSFSGGGGTGAAASALVSGGVIVGVVVTAPGSGYTSAPTANLTGTGTGATLGTVVIAGGQIAGVAVTNPGSGYTTAPAVNFSGTGTGAHGTALLAPAGVASVSVTWGGTGFTSVPLITFIGGGGAGAVGTVSLTSTSVAAVQVTAGGSGYNFTPIVSFLGGGGQGATAVCNMNGDQVASITVTNGGSGYSGPIELGLTTAGAGQTGSGAGGIVLYAPTSIASVTVSAAGEFYTSAPSIVVSPGANNAAYATINLMPYGVSGSAIESFLSRIWIIAPAQAVYETIPAQTQFTVGAPGSIWNFNTSAGATTQTSVSSYLQTEYTGVRQSAGYVYLFGDQSIGVVSNVATSGTPTVTTFNYQNVDPQVGLSWRDTLQDFGRAELLTNTIGVYGLYGGAATKVSQKLDGIFRQAVFPPFVGAVAPSAAVASIFDVKHYLCLMTVVDPDTELPRNVMIAWNEKDWGILSQSPALTFINTQAIGTTFSAFGTDGARIYPLFNKPSTAITKRLETKFYGGDKPMIVKALSGVWLTASDLSTGGVGVSGTLAAVVSGTPNAYAPPNAEVATIQNQLYVSWNNQPNFKTPYPYFATWGTAPQSDVAFTTIGLRFSSTSPDFVLANCVIGYTEEFAIF